MITQPRRAAGDLGLRDRLQPRLGGLKASRSKGPDGLVTERIDAVIP